MKSKQLRNVMLAALGLSVMGASLPVYAATSASVSVSSMYLWRGQTLSGAGPAVSGDIYFNHDSGVYAGIWTSSEGISGSHETDLNVGFAKKFGNMGIDVGIYEYLYPEAQSCTTTVVAGVVEEACDEKSLSDSDASEFYLGASFGPVSAKLLVNTDESENMYLTIDGTFGSFGAHIGSTMNKESSAEYIDFNVSYTPVANLTWIVSVASGDGAPEEDPLFVVSYKWPFDIK